MSVVNSINFFTQANAKADTNVAFRFENDFPSKLTLGQIIKGKVLRSYSEGRYGVGFAGQEKVVDSAIPLKTGEILYGRVVGLDEQVTLQRVRSAVSDATGNNVSNSASSSVLTGKGNNPEKQLEAFFLQHNVKLPLESKTILLSLLSAATKTNMMLNSGLILQKLGLPLDVRLLRAIYRVLGDDGFKSPLHESVSTATLSAQPKSDHLGGDHQVVAQLLAALTSKASAELRQTGKSIEQEHAVNDSESETDEFQLPVIGDAADDASNFRGEDKQERQLGRFLLNAQTDGSVSHRLIGFPIWLGDRLVEVEMALFSQRENASQIKGDIQYQRLVFSLQSDVLGHVEISVAVANRHLKIDIGTNNEAATQSLARYMPDLKASLVESDWQIDELTYRTHFLETEDQVLGSIVEHYISQDSLSRLM